MTRDSNKHQLAGKTSSISMRLGASLFAAGGFITLLSMGLPHPESANEKGYFALAGLQLLIAAWLRLRAPTNGEWIPWFITTAGTAVVAASVLFNGERGGGPALLNEIYFVWPVLYAGYFFGARMLAVGVAITGVSYAAVLVAIGPEMAVTRWVVTMSVVIGVGLTVHALRRHVDGLVARLRLAMHTDPLTAVLNRRGFEERFEVEIERVSRTDEPLAVLVGDLDHFKALNDRYGHGAGDDALAAVGRALGEASRGVDTVARIGGEEFAVLMPATTASGAFEAAERLRARVSEIIDPDDRPLTISFGLVTFAGPGRVEPQVLLAAADTALYAAKAQGRDRTVSFEEPALA